MKRIEIQENGILMVFEVTEEREIKLLHFSAAPFSAADISEWGGQFPVLADRAQRLLGLGDRRSGRTSVLEAERPYGASVPLVENLLPGESFESVPVAVGSLLGGFDEAMGELTAELTDKVSARIFEITEK